jgi:hypothetical protein
MQTLTLKAHADKHGVVRLEIPTRLNKYLHTVH